MSRPRSDEPPAAWLSRGLSRTPPAVHLAVVLPVVIAIAATAVQPWLPPGDLLRDSQVIAAAHGGASPAYGLLSNLGIIVVALSTGAAAFGRLLLHGTAGLEPRLLGWIAVLSLALVLDDLLLLHEAATFGPSAGALFAAAYGLAFLRFVVRFRDAIVHDLDVGLLLLAVGSLAVSVVTDVVVAPTQASVLLEDGAKLLGLVAWSAFALRTALFALGHLRTTSPGADAAPARPAHREDSGGLRANR